LIERLRISDLALVEHLELEFGPGLNVLTGETGAGKSIVLGALALLAGGRARSGDVREGAEQAVVEAVFDTRALPALEADLAARGLEPEEHELIVRRSQTRKGRSRAWVGGQLVPVGVLADLFAAPIEIASQHGSQALLRPESQGRLLDAFGGLLDAREAVAQGVHGLRALDEELARLRTQAEELARREDYLGFQVREIDEAGLDPHAVVRIEEEHRRLAHAGRLHAAADAAAEAVVGDPATSGLPGAADQIRRAARALTELGPIDAALGGLGERLAACLAELEDSATDLERYAAGIEADPGRLARLEEELAQLERLKRKYGASAEEILAFRERAAGELAALGRSGERMQALDAERELLQARLVKAAARLSRGRKRAARRLAAAAQEGIRQLAMPEACFEVTLAAAPPPAGMPCGPGGAELPAFLFSANPGEAPKPLRQVASGGELSRLFLYLKNTLRLADAGMVLVFDEVDAGVSGAVAERVGSVLAGLAREHQVLCITHLPQIAAQAAQHFRVEKSTGGGRTRSSVLALDRPGRVEELARMAGGAKVSEATRRHARALLSAASAGE